MPSPARCRQELMPAHRARLALAARARGDDEIVFAAADRIDEPRHQIAAIGAVTIHEHDDAAFGRGGGGSGGACPAIAASRPETMTRAPAAAAAPAVPSLLPPSTTMISCTRSRGISATTPPIDCASFSVGMTTATLEAPSQAAILARLWRHIADQGRAEFLIGVAVPDLAQGLLGSHRRAYRSRSRAPRTARCSTANARPCAVKYISDHGRRHADHGVSPWLASG